MSGTAGAGAPWAAFDAATGELLASALVPAGREPPAGLFPAADWRAGAWRAGLHRLGADGPEEIPAVPHTAPAPTATADGVTPWLLRGLPPDCRVTVSRGRLPAPGDGAAAAAAPDAAPARRPATGITQTGGADVLFSDPGLWSVTLSAPGHRPTVIEVEAVDDP